jgi:prephenate dehydrogenase
LSRSETVKAGIIGGTGKMGALFAGIFTRAGYEVLIAGRSTALTPRALAEQCDIVMVSVPIHDTVRVIQDLSPLLSEGQLVCDLTSLKVRPVEAMLESKAQVIGLHPMFGPTVSSLRHQTIVVCPARADEKTLRNLLAVLKAEGAECTITTPDAHDRMMAIVQGLTHFVTLCMADSVRRLAVDIETTKAFTSPVYQIELALVGRLLSQDPSLYADILQMNPFVPDVLSVCTSSAGNLSRIVGSDDPALFREFFEANSRHFGAYTNEGMTTTDALIEYMVNR